MEQRAEYHAGPQQQEFNCPTCGRAIGYTLRVDGTRYLFVGGVPFAYTIFYCPGCGRKLRWSNGIKGPGKLA